LSQKEVKAIWSGVSRTPSRVVCKENKQAERGGDTLPQHDLGEQKNAVEACERHQEKTF